MEVQDINLCEWTLTGGGAQGESYERSDMPDLMLKVFFVENNNDAIFKEVDISNAVYENGIPSPKPGILVRTGDRYGIIFNKIRNKKSFSRLIADNPDKIGEIARRFALMGRELHSTECHDNRFEYAIDYYQRLLNRCTSIDDHMREVMQKQLDLIALDRRTTFLHGDFHMGNVITDGSRDYFIDLGLFCYGHPDFDIAMLYLVCFISPEEMVMDFYHITRAQAQEFWKWFVFYYYGENAPSPEEFMKRFAPYLLIRTLMIEDIRGQEPVLFQVRNLFLKEVESAQ